MTRRRRLIAVTVGSLAGFAMTAAVALGVHAQSGVGGVGCALQGSVQISPGLGATYGAQTLTLTGTLSGCQASGSGAPATATVAAGSITLNGVAYQLPPVKGTGDCAQASLGGPLVLTWSDGTITVLDANISGDGPQLTVYGQTGSSVTATAVSGSGSVTFTTSRYQTDVAAGELGVVFTSPAGCAGSGVTQAQVAGPLGIGGSS